MSVVDVASAGFQAIYLARDPGRAWRSYMGFCPRTGMPRYAGGKISTQSLSQETTLMAISGYRGDKRSKYMK